MEKRRRVGMPRGAGEAVGSKAYRMALRARALQRVLGNNKWLPLTLCALSADYEQVAKCRRGHSACTLPSHGLRFCLHSLAHLWRMRRKRGLKGFSFLPFPY